MNFQESIEIPCILRCFIHTFFIGGVLIERAHYYANFAERGRTIRWCVLIEEGTVLDFSLKSAMCGTIR